MVDADYLGSVANGIQAHHKTVLNWLRQKHYYSEGLLDRQLKGTRNRYETMAWPREAHHGVGYLVGQREGDWTERPTCW